MYYFKFAIPKNKDGSVVTYSPGWCGTRDKCAQNEVGLLYNDKELWGIGQAEGDFVPDDVEVSTEKEAKKLINDTDGEQVFKGEKILSRYVVKEQIVDLPPDFDAGFKASPAVEQAVREVLNGN